MSVLKKDRNVIRWRTERMDSYLLDTNTVSYLLKGHASVTRHILNSPVSALFISAITEGELLFGLAKRPEAKTLQRVVNEFLLRVDVLPWDRAAAGCYGTLRAALDKQGHGLAPLDLLIAAHALSSKMVLVSSDHAFQKIAGLRLEDWTQ